MKQELNVKRKANSRKEDQRERAKAATGVRRRKRRARKYTIYYVLIIIIVLSAMITLSMTVFFNIKNISVSQSEIYTSDEVIEASGVEIGENMMRLNIKDAEQKILDKLIYIDDIQIKRKLPDTLSIEYTPAEITYNYNINGTYAYISQSGRILELGKEEPYPFVLTVIGLNIEEPEVGVFISEKDDSGQMEKLEKLRQSLEQNAFDYSDITLMDISSESQTLVEYQGRITIEINASDDEEYVISAAKALIDGNSIGVAEKGTIFFVESTQQIHFVPKSG